MENTSFYDVSKIDLREEVLSSIPKISQIQSIFIGEIKKKISKKDSILDLGTGNGYVLIEIDKELKSLELELYGIDSSEEMIEKAKNNLSGATFIRGDNYSLPFGENTFDLVVAKNVTRFSPEETYRVLKNGGHFIFREYGKGKGLIEIANLFPNRILRSKDPNSYESLLNDAGFEAVSVKKFNKKTKYSLQQLLKILKIFPFIENYSPEDEKIVIEFFGKKNEMEITSDPILVIGTKK